MQTGLKTKLDYADYCAIPPDGKRYELIVGRVHVIPAPSPSHQRLVQGFLRILEDHFRSPVEALVSPVDVILTPHDVVQPDLVVVAEPAQVSDRGIEGAPLIVVEVLSPATGQYDRTTKAQRYAALGVPHYWLVDPASRQVECYRLAGGRYQSVATGSAEATVSHPDFPDLHLSGPTIWR
ncbi:MAG: Uma2 family endonuclease [candidate division NC10 bacterium]|nr:Uma2 family endonuclease [candidate division NC10 bacterium]